MENSLKHLQTGFVALAFLVWFGGQTIIGLAPAWLLFQGAEALGIGIILLMVDFTINQTSRVIYRLAYMFVFIGWIMLSIAGLMAMKRADIVQSRCALIEHAMIGDAKDTRGDLPAIFTAMKCQPGG